MIRFSGLLPGLLMTSAITLSASYLYSARDALSTPLLYGAKLALITLALLMFYRPKGADHDVA